MTDTEVKEDSIQKIDEATYSIKDKLMRTEEGELVPTAMFDFLEVPLDDYSDLKFTLEEVRRVRMHAMKMRTGIQAMAPIMCLGPVKCPFGLRCPIVDRSLRLASGNIDLSGQDIKKFPLMRQCIFERDFLDFKRKQYMEEYEVNMESPTELGLVNKLAELDLYEYRATLVLAHGDDRGEGMDLLKAQESGSSATGETLHRLELHPAFELKERLHKMREAILTSMVGTRREQYKQAAALKLAEGKDPSSATSALRDRIIQLENEGVIDAQFTETKEEEKK
jgi:hypothetical protein